MDNLAMNAIELIGDIDDQLQLRAHVPNDLPPDRFVSFVLLLGEANPAACGRTGLPGNGRRNCATLSGTFTRWTTVGR